VTDSNQEAEPLLGMREITRFIFAETGHRPGRSTIWRWGLTGRLESRRIGGRLFATERAIRSMLAADEQRNRGSATARGMAATQRIEALTARNSTRSTGGRG
jgi:hypothetical protein